MTWQYDIEWHHGGNRRTRHRTRNISTSTSQEENKTDNNRMNVVVISSKPRSQIAGNLVTTHAWTSLMEEEEDNIRLKPVIQNAKNINITHFNTTILYEDENRRRPLVIYAQVLRGASPILKAKVMLKVTVEQTNGSNVKFPTIELHDNGYGGEF